MRFKKLLSLGIILSMTSSVLVGCSSNKDNSKSSGESLKITLVADVGGINDESFNQSAWEGLQRAKDKLGVDVNVLESKQSSDYVPNVETAVDNDSDLVIGVGFQMNTAIENAAKSYPETNFAIIDASFENQPENVSSLMFNAQEASYLTGIIAAKKSETNKVGFIGGTKEAVIETFEYGFMAGAKAVDSNIEVLRQYADTYTDASKAKSIANLMHSKDVDVIFTAAGSAGLGPIEAAKENNKMAVGVDKDQNSLAPENVITSAIKRVDVAVFNTVKDLLEGNFKGGQVNVFGLKEDGVGISETTSKNVDKEILALVEEHAQKIKNGEIKVPSNKKDYEEFLK